MQDILLSPQQESEVTRSFYSLCNRNDIVHSCEVLTFTQLMTSRNMGQLQLPD